MGTPEFAVGTLKRLYEDGYNIVAVVTQPDRPVGRHQDTLQPSEVKKYALAHGLPILQPEKMKDPTFIEQLASYKADLQIVVAFRMFGVGPASAHSMYMPHYSPNIVERPPSTGPSSTARRRPVSLPFSLTKTSTRGASSCKGTSPYPMMPM